MSNQHIEENHKQSSAIAREIVETLTLLDDMTARDNISNDWTLTEDGLCGLNRIIQRMRVQAVELLGSI